MELVTSFTLVTDFIKSVCSNQFLLDAHFSYKSALKKEMNTVTFSSFSYISLFAV